MSRTISAEAATELYKKIQRHLHDLLQYGRLPRKDTDLQRGARQFNRACQRALDIATDHLKDAEKPVSKKTLDVFVANVESMRVDVHFMTTSKSDQTIIEGVCKKITDAVDEAVRAVSDKRDRDLDDDERAIYEYEAWEAKKKQSKGTGASSKLFKPEPDLTAADIDAIIENDRKTPWYAKNYTPGDSLRLPMCPSCGKQKSKPGDSTY